MENTQRIAVISRKLRLACSGLILCLPFVVAAFWVFFNQVYSSLRMVPLPVRVDHDLSGLTRLLAFSADLIPLAATIYGLLRLRDLFGLYENGLIFTERNVHCFRSLGRTLLVWVGCDIVRYSILSVVLTLENPPGQRLLVVGINSGELAGVFTAIVVLIISWVMEEARKLREDQQLIV
ncbi:DUF2975 domain-containing protein [Desulfomonile tiedjei]|uniref:DUF2975 domain-containing protein n=1 Tax=Desulfomonile tiedjei (strain ATCC 49306 / DSM 6799 / DCB-1) TaxID=706587 RepID=I4C3G0_DESTA|nr:DUF2975 domain-containing protein [Desulfomonile tiedjei]AFM24101.1 Protein of unknown function (DUF2975) [Desulfomonile tiedjei DSM 6799]